MINLSPSSHQSSQAQAERQPLQARHYSVGRISPIPSTHSASLPDDSGANAQSGGTASFLDRLHSLRGRL